MSTQRHRHSRSFKKW